MAQEKGAEWSSAIYLSQEDRAGSLGYYIREDDTENSRHLQRVPFESSVEYPLAHACEANTQGQEKKHPKGLEGNIPEVPTGPVVFLLTRVENFIIRGHRVGYSGLCLSNGAKLALKTVLVPPKRIKAQKDKATSK